MISEAKLNYLKIAPRKVRLVADLIRGKKFEKAQNILRFTQKRAAKPIKKLLYQAFANAEDQHPGVIKNNLKISKIIVNEGPMAKSRFPRAQGKADIIKKRSSHVEIVLDEIKKGVKDTTKQKKKQKKKEDKKKEKKETKIEKREKRKRQERTKREYSKTKKGKRAKRKDQVFHKKSF